MGVATVRGYEGADISSAIHVASSLKHYVGYSYPTTGADRSPALIPEITLREYFLPTFAAAIKAGARTVMVNSGEMNGIPGHANSYLLKTVLRDELGFRGVVVSGWMDIKKLVNVHHIAAKLESKLTPKERRRAVRLRAYESKMAALHDAAQRLQARMEASYIQQRRFKNGILDESEEKHPKAANARHRPAGA
jgi:beta-glucosidase-like glycosyl hydrolase